MDPLAQAEAPSRAGSLSLVGGRLCLDFVNTASGRHGPCRIEHLRSYDDLLTWALHAGVLTSADAGALRGLATSGPSAAARALRRGLALRETMDRIFVAVIGNAPPPEQAGATLNRFLADAMARARIDAISGVFRWGWRDRPPAFERPLWPVVRSAAELLTGADLRRLKECPGRDCGWLFLDATKNAGRRWCEMRVCGSRAKARRYHERRRSSGRPVGAPVMTI